mgnify:FL=1
MFYIFNTIEIVVLRYVRIIFSIWTITDASLGRVFIKYCFCIASIECDSRIFETSNGSFASTK